VGEETGGKREASGEVFLERDSLGDNREELVVDGLLVGDAVGSDGLLLSLGLLVEELLLGLGLDRGVNLLEVGVVDGLRNLDAGDINLSRSGNDVGLVDTADGDTVDLEGTRNEEESRVQALQEDDALSTEVAGQKDENGAGSDRGTKRTNGGLLGGVDAGSGLVEATDVLSLVDSVLLSVLTLLLDGVLNSLRNLLHSGGSGSLAELDLLVLTTLGEHSTLSILLDAVGDERVTRLLDLSVGRHGELLPTRNEEDKHQKQTNKQTAVSQLSEDNFTKKTPPIQTLRGVYHSTMLIASIIRQLQPFEREQEPNESTLGKTPPFRHSTLQATFTCAQTTQ